MWLKFTKSTFVNIKTSLNGKNEVEGNMMMSAIMTLRKLVIHKMWTITFIKNNNDKLPWLLTNFISSSQKKGVNKYIIIHTTFQANCSRNSLCVGDSRAFSKVLGIRPNHDIDSHQEYRSYQEMSIVLSFKLH